jgi:hypothetical protein
VAQWVKHSSVTLYIRGSISGLDIILLALWSLLQVRDLQQKYKKVKHKFERRIESGRGRERERERDREKERREREFVCMNSWSAIIS